MPVFVKMSLLLAILTFVGFVSAIETDYYALLMPHVRPLSPESYLCTTVKLDEYSTSYIIEFSPNASMHTAHHMLLYGCTSPGRMEQVWDCGEMQGSSSNYKKGQICASGSQIIYAWAKDAPKLTLPDATGFKVGAGTTIKFLVLQVHYLEVQRFIDGATDDSGVVLTYTETPMPRLAGVVMLGTSGYIPAKNTVNMESACTITENKVLHPIAFRTHTHALGTVVSGYVVKDSDKINHKWIRLGKKNPQLPQMFYPVENKNVEIRKGDVLAARCTMKSQRETTTFIGSTSNDEMCNFYLLYWVDGTDVLERKYCFTRGYPYWFWKDFPLNNIPYDASEL